MAAPPELAASLNYLTDAAHLLRTAAPETSAHLMSQRASLLYHHGMAVSETQRQHVCGACGHIMIPGQGTRITLESKKGRQGRQDRKSRKGSGHHHHTAKAKQAAAASGPVKVISCGLCDRATRTCLPAPERATRRRMTMPKAKKQVDMVDKRQAPITSAANVTANVTANASSKKRAKSRKAGLQALLSGQQQRQSNPLSLADFGR
ncbi:hypothetical protein ESCO_001722 [Escovopsis weberi]|uniref:Uncharacterized protein n=1 Tax=Escovopsis weberi TaxID=150374 RepID=A0A0M9VWY0_ESCWE|nr:hypothetical protein ESCO_001722 [Escovopsis weberi]